MKTTDISELYQKLQQKCFDVFFEIEAGFCTAFEELEEKPVFVKAFISLVNWNNLSSSDGSCAFYEDYIPERADKSYLTSVLLVLKKMDGKDEICRFFQSGFQDEMKDNPSDEKNKKYRVIDDYIDDHFEEIWETEEMILKKYKQEIIGLFSK